MTGRFFKKKKEMEKLKPEEDKETDLENICGNDKEAYNALRHTMFYDPRKVKVTMKDAAKKAADLEEKGDHGRAKTWYHVAGGLALWKDDVKKVQQYFGKCAELAPEGEYQMIAKIPKRAAEKAQEFYKKFLK